MAHVLQAPPGVLGLTVCGGGRGAGLGLWEEGDGHTLVPSCPPWAPGGCWCPAPPPMGVLVVCREAARHGTGTAASQLPDVSSLASPRRDECWLRDLLRKLFIFRG